MKTQFILAFFLVLNYSLFCQINPRQYNVNYTYTKFEDEFNGTSVDQSKWDPGLIHRGIGELIFSPLTHKVTNGKLELTMQYSPNYNDSSDFIGAEFKTDSTFLYGIFECEASFAKGVSSWPAFWSMHQLPCPNNEGPEIDFAEYFCKTPYNKKLGHYIHHWNAAPCGVSGGEASTNYNDDYQFSTSTNKFKCIWTPEKIEYYIDNIKKATHTNNGTDWFPDRPVAVVVSQQITQWGSVPHEIVSPVYPQTSSFSYVKVKKFFLAPEITVTGIPSIPGIICSSGSAVLDVDSKADSITWSLTPTNLFSGNKTGTGKTATITAITGASGQGTIIYTFRMPSIEIYTAEKNFWVGKAGTPTSIFPFANNGMEFGSNTEYEFRILSETGATSYTWSVQGGTILSGQGTGSIIVRTATATGVNINFTVAAKAINNCGESAFFVRTGWVVPGSGGSTLVFAPNPTSGETTLSIESESPDLTFDESAEWELEVYDQVQTLKEKNSKVKGKEYKIQTAGWKEGVYFVRVKYKDEILTGQLVVKQ